MPIPVLIHLSLLALMVLFCVAAAVIARRRAVQWLPRHRLLGLLGAISGVIGMAVMIAEKIEHGYPHFHSPHSLIGLAVGLLLIGVPLLGFLGTRGYNPLRKPHRLSARLLIFLGLTALVTGIYRYLQINRN